MLRIVHRALRRLRTDPAEGVAARCLQRINNTDVSRESHQTSIYSDRELTSRASMRSSARLLCHFYTNELNLEVPMTSIRTTIFSNTAMSNFHQISAWLHGSWRWSIRNESHGVDPRASRLSSFRAITSKSMCTLHATVLRQALAQATTTEKLRESQAIREAALQLRILCIADPIILHGVPV